MRRISRITIILPALFLLLLASCATQDRSKTLTSTLSAYGGILRWGDIASAAQFIDPAIREKHPLTDIERARYKQIRITEYDDGAGPHALDEFDVQQTVHINLVNIHTQTERSIIDHQTWHYDEKTKHWWLTSGLPDITRD